MARRSWTVWMTVLVFPLVGACTWSGMAAKLLTAKEREVAPKVVSAIQRGDFEAVKELSWPESYQNVPDSMWTILRTSLQGVNVDSMRLVGLQVVTRSGVGRIAYQWYEARLPNGWAEIRIRTRDDRVDDFHGAFQTESVGEEYSFWNAPLRPSQGLLLLWALGTTLLSLGAALRVLRSHMKRRWLWAPLSFAVLGRLSLNWTTGAISGSPFYVSLLPLSWVRYGLASPWYMGVGVPVFAVIAWRKATLASRPPSFDSSPDAPAPCGPVAEETVGSLHVRHQ